MKRTMRLKVEGEEITVVAERRGSTLTLEHGGEEYTVEILPEKDNDSPPPGQNTGGSLGASMPRRTDGGRSSASSGKDEAQAHAVVANHAGAGLVTAPMTGTVKEVVAPVGTAVSDGDLVVMMEAMKMDIEVAAGASGSVQEVFVVEGQSIRDGEPLLRIE